MPAEQRALTSGTLLTMAWTFPFARLLFFGKATPLLKLM